MSNIQLRTRTTLNALNDVVTELRSTLQELEVTIKGQGEEKTNEKLEVQ